MYSTRQRFAFESICTAIVCTFFDLSHFGGLLSTVYPSKTAPGCNRVEMRKQQPAVLLDVLDRRALHVLDSSGSLHTRTFNLGSPWMNNGNRVPMTRR